INEDSGPTNVSLTGISYGPTNENQTITVTATSSNTNLTGNLTVLYASPNSGGTLSFAPLTNANGSAIITVTVRDNGGTNNGSSDTFSRAFTLTVIPVNDPPVAIND